MTTWQFIAFSPVLVTCSWVMFKHHRIVAREARVNALIARVIHEQWEKEAAPNRVAPYDFPQRITATFQRFVRAARTEGLPVPADLTERLRSKLSTKPPA